MWWTLSAALANPGADASLAVALDPEASARDRVKAVRTLGRLDPGDPSVADIVTPLAAQLASPLPDDLTRAIRRTLGRLNASSVWTVELGSPDAGTRRRAAGLLGESDLTPHPPAGPALVGVLNDPVASVRAAAANALVAHPQADAVDDLAQRLDDPAIRVRMAASRTLGFLGGQAAEEALMQRRLVESDVMVRHYLDAALGHIARHQDQP